MTTKLDLPAYANADECGVRTLHEWYDCCAAIVGVVNTDGVGASR